MPIGAAPGVTRKELFEFVLKEGLLSKANTKKVKEEMVQYITSRMPDVSKEDILNKVSLLANRFLVRWKASGRKKSSFLQKNGNTVQKNLHLPLKPALQEESNDILRE